MYKSEIGSKFGRALLTGISAAGADGLRVAHCLCDCGKRFDTKLSFLNRGVTSSCGCFRKDCARALLASRPNSAVTHGHTRGDKPTPEYVIWAGMIQRCVNPKHTSYSRYGGRGIAVCERWMRFDDFLEDMGTRPTAKHTIDREDNDLGYAPGNCSWATRKQQSRHTANSRILTFNGETMILADWAERLGLSQSALIHRLKTGWSNDEALSTPSMRGISPTK